MKRAEIEANARKPYADALVRFQAQIETLTEACGKAHSTISDECGGGVDHPTARMLYDAIETARSFR